MIGWTRRTSVSVRSCGTGSAPVAAATPWAASPAQGPASWARALGIGPAANSPKKRREDAGQRRALPDTHRLTQASVGLGHRRPSGGEAGAEEVPVHPGDGIDADLLGAGLLAFAVEGAPAEPFDVHLPHHLPRAHDPLGLPLGQQAEVGDL